MNKPQTISKLESFTDKHKGTTWQGQIYRNKLKRSKVREMLRFWEIHGFACLAWQTASRTKSGEGKSTDFFLTLNVGLKIERKLENKLDSYTTLLSVNRLVIHAVTW